MDSSFYQPASQNSSNRKIILIVVIVAVVLCCCCLALAGAGVLAYNYAKPLQNQSLPFPDIDTKPSIAETDVPFPYEEATPEIPESDLPEPTEPVTEPPVVEPTLPVSGAQGAGLGVSREEMISFFNMGDAFTFDEPQELQGMEYVQGTHDSLCVGSDCASVVLAGPADNLQVVSIAVPTDPDDTVQSLMSVTLLMTAASRFTDLNSPSGVPAQMMNDIIEAQKSGKDLEKNYTDNGYAILVTYNASTHIAGLAISRSQ